MKGRKMAKRWGKCREASRYSRTVDKMVNIACDIYEYYEQTGSLLIPALKKYFKLIKILHIPTMQGKFEENCTVDLNQIPKFNDKELLDELVGRVHYCSDRMSQWRAIHIRKLYKEVCKRGLS